MYKGSNFSTSSPTLLSVSFVDHGHSNGCEVISHCGFCSYLLFSGANTFSHTCSVQSLSYVWLLQPHGLQHARPPCPSPNPGVYSNSCALSWWCHPTISSSVIHFSSRLHSFPASGSFQMSQFFTSGSQSIGASASTSVLPMNIHGWFPLGLTGLIFLQLYSN